MQLFESVTDVWITWLICFLILTIRGYRLLTSFRGWSSFAWIHRDERGASYVLSYIMSLTIYIIVFTLMLQSTMILTVKLGSMNAAYSATRSVIVWRTAHPTNNRKGYDLAKARGKRAAATAMAPFAPSFRIYLDRMNMKGVLPNIGAMLHAELYAERYATAYDSLIRNRPEAKAGSKPLMRDRGSVAKHSAVANKYRYAYAATTVTFDRKVPKWNEEMSVTTSYVMPMQIPIGGAILGDFFSRPNYHRTISTTVTMPAEVAESKNSRIGIPYEPKGF